MFDWILILGGWLFAAGVMTILFLVQRRMGDAGIVDVAWSLGVAALAVVYAVGGPTVGGRAGLVLAVVLVWGGVFMPLNHGDLSEWLQEVAENAPDKFDIANIHVRDDLDKLPDMVAEFIEMFSSIGFDGPVWVSEHGYTSDPNYQTDKNYKNGLISQAEYYASSINDILDNGVDKVFVTLRDNDELEAADVAEGLLAQVIDDQTTGEVTFIEKPSYIAVQELINADASATPTPTPTPSPAPGECDAKSITAASELSLARGESEEVTVTVKGDNDCFSEGVTVKAKIKKGKKFIKIPAKTAEDRKSVV